MGRMRYRVSQIAIANRFRAGPDNQDFAASSVRPNWVIPTPTRLILPPAYVGAQAR